MGKLPYVTYSDSDETEGVSSTEKFKKKNKNLTQKIKSNIKKKKFKQSKSEPDESYYRSSRSSRSSSRSSGRSSRSKSHSNIMLKQKLRGILKHTAEKESSEEDEVEPWSRSQGRCLIGQVPQLPGAKPGGGFAFVIRRNTYENNLPSPSAGGSAKQRRSNYKGLSQKRSY